MHKYEKIEKYNYDFPDSIERLIESMSNQIRLFSLVEFLNSKHYLQYQKTDFYAIYYFKSSQGVFSSQNHEVRVVKNHLLLVPTQLLVRFDYIHGDGTVLLFEDSFIRQNIFICNFFYQSNLFNRSKDVTYFPIGEQKSNFDIYFELIKNELDTQPSAIKTKILGNTLYSLLLVVQQLLGNDKKSYLSNRNLDLVNQFKNLVYQEENKNQSIKYFCKILNIKASILEKAFKECEYQTPKQWLIQIIIYEIKLEIQNNSNNNISEIAFKNGFNEISNFTKFFKKHCGITPSDFKRNTLFGNK